MKEPRKLTSFYAHDDEVQFKPMFRQQQELGISDEWRIGRIIGIRFTKAKVFYDIVDDYYGHLFRDVDSTKVREADAPRNVTFVDPNEVAPDEPESSRN